MPYCVTTRLLSRRVSRPIRVPWLSPALASHQQLDAGIAARHQADRKNLKKSKRPFANYFRTEYRCSSMRSSPVARANGRIMSYNAVRLMTDPKFSWSTFWGRAMGGVRTRKKRQDVLEPPARQFGDDDLDRAIERLLQLRFQWDRADDILAVTLVPSTLQAMTEHCFSYSSRLQQRQRGFPRQQAQGSNGGAYSAHAPLSVPQEYDWNNLPTPPEGSLGVSGVDTVPAIVLDAVRGPLVSSPAEVSPNLRWKTSGRESTSVNEVLHIHRCLSRVSAVGIPARSLFLVLKAHATVEVQDPPLAVALAIAAAEHYHGYSYTECLELLRSLRRIAYVKGLTHFSGSHTAVSALYQDASLSRGFFSQYIKDAAPFLVEKVWSRLPEHVHRLARCRFYLDFVDLLSLAVEMNGWSLPCNLPNAASSAAYASKYLFLRYTLQMDEAFMEQFTSSLTEAICGKSSHLSFAHLVAQCNAQAGQQGQLEVEGGEMVVQSLVTWLCASFLVRITAEALGDVLRHVEASLKEHMQLAMRCTAGAAQGDSRQEWLKVEKDLQLFLDRIALVRPRHSVYQCIGRRPPRRLRLRVIPFEAFPEIYRRMRLPFEAEAKQADACTAKPRRTSTARSGRSMASVVASSAIAQKHIDRACSALDWASMVLTHCTTFLRHLPVEAPQSQPPGPSSPHNAPVVIPSASSPFYSGAAGDNFARCEALVRSRVQNDVDSLFRYISWNELEEQLQSLSRPDEGGKDSGSDEGLTSSLVDAGFLSDFLTDSMGGPESGSAVVGQCETDAKVGTVCQRPSKTYSRDEERALKLLESLQSSVESFQIAVAKLIDTQEEFFLMV